MSEEDAFLRAICDQPDDDTARLVFADWLDEHNRPERAEFIRVQCELASGRGVPVRRTELRKRSMQLFQAFAQQWFVQDWPDAGANTVTGYTFDRGFVDTVSFMRRGLRNADIVRLLDTRPQFALLRNLNLSMNELSDDGLRAIADCPRLARLRHLILSANPVTLQGMELLAASPHLTSLNEVTLNHLVNPDNVLAALNATQTAAQETEAIFRRYGKNVLIRT